MYMGRCHHINTICSSTPGSKLAKTKSHPKVQHYEIKYVSTKLVLGWVCVLPDLGEDLEVGSVGHLEQYIVD